MSDSSVGRKSRVGPDGPNKELTELHPFWNLWSRICSSCLFGISLWPHVSPALLLSLMSLSPASCLPLRRTLVATLDTPGHCRVVSLSQLPSFHHTCKVHLAVEGPIFTGSGDWSVSIFGGLSLGLLQVVFVLTELSSSLFWVQAVCLCVCVCAVNIFSVSGWPWLTQGSCNLEESLFVCMLFCGPVLCVWELRTSHRNLCP